MLIFSTVGPFYHSFMCFFELPLVVARSLTVPLLHGGTYRRRMAAVSLPFSFALLTFVLTTHILEDLPLFFLGCPTFVWAWAAGLCLALPMYFFWLPQSSDNLHQTLEEGQPLASSGHAKKKLASFSEKETREHEAQPLPGHQKEAAADELASRWCAPLVSLVAGPSGDPMPHGAVFLFYLVLSFFMSLVWLLLITNELVGAALCFGKILSIPDIVMGLIILAIGNSINDLAASVTIAREGYPSMAVAGAYAGPMFNVLAGIGLPMLIYTAGAEGQGYAIGKDTLIVWVAFATLLTSLVGTLVWVPLAGFRITHKIGRALLTWFVLFVVLIIVMGSIPSLSGEDEGVVLE